MPRTRPHPVSKQINKPVPVDWHDSAWLPRVIVRCAAADLPAGSRPDDSARHAAPVPFRLPRLRFSPLAVFSLAPGRDRSSPRPPGRAGAIGHAPRITYHSSRPNSL